MRNGMRHDRHRVRLPPVTDEYGTVTAEFAVVLPCVVVVAALLLSLTRTVVVAMDCQDAAAVVARTLVMESDGRGARTDVVSIASQLVDGETSVDVDWRGRYVDVTVTCSVLPGPLGVLPARVTGSATGVRP